MMPRSLNCALILCFSICCTPIPTPESSSAESAHKENSSPDQGTPLADGTSGEERETERVAALELALEVAHRTATAYDEEKGATEEFSMSLRIRVEGKPASLKADGSQIGVLEGAAGAAHADVTVDLLRAQALAIVDGESTLKGLIDRAEVATDNAQGLARFGEFLGSSRTGPEG